MPILAEQGYIIPAFNTDTTDYESCAQRLRDSLLHWHPKANVTVITTQDLPHGDQGGQANDWQMFAASPYRETIKLEADMLVTGPVDHWWTTFRLRDVVISQGCRDYHGQPSQARAYRKLFDANQLPDVYNAITYWRLSATAKQFFDLTKSIWQNWSQFKTLLKFPDESPTTDVVYAMAAQIMGPDTVTLPPGMGPSMVHMKRDIIKGAAKDWRDHCVWEWHDGVLRINTISQWGFFHYHYKDWQP